MEINVVGVEARVCKEIEVRQTRGIAKYGTTLGDNPAAMIARLQHFKEEMLDGAMYAEWCIERLKQMEDDGK